MAFHRNFTASYDTRGITDLSPGGSYLNEPGYLNHGLDNGYETAPYPGRYYDRQAGYHAVVGPAGLTRAKPSWSRWDPQAIADPAYFYQLYGTASDPLTTSRDGNDNAYWGAEYAERPRLANRHFTNWIGHEFWRHGKRGLPKGRGEMKNFLSGVAPNFPIYEDELPTPYVIVSGARGRMDLKNRLIQIPAGAMLIFLAEPQDGDSTAHYREYIEAVQVPSRPSFY